MCTSADKDADLHSDSAKKSLQMAINTAEFLVETDPVMERSKNSREFTGASKEVQNDLQW
jgi:hypothetical protein